MPRQRSSIFARARARLAAAAARVRKPVQDALHGGRPTPILCDDLTADRDPAKEDPLSLSPGAAPSASSSPETARRGCRSAARRRRRARRADAGAAGDDPGRLPPRRKALHHRQHRRHHLAARRASRGALPAAAIAAAAGRADRVAGVRRRCVADAGSRLHVSAPGVAAATPADAACRAVAGAPRLPRFRGSSTNG